MENPGTQQATRRPTTLRYRLEAHRGAFVPDTPIGVAATATVALLVVGATSLVWHDDPLFAYWAVVGTALVLGRKVYRLRRRGQLYRR